MLIWTARLSKKKAVCSVIALGVAIAALVCLLAKPAADHGSAAPKLTTNEERIAYLNSYGWEVAPEPLETLQFLLPEKLEEPYLSYNTLQQSQGFDLETCCGKHVSRYTYAVTNYPGRPEGIQANLYICEELPVAGDIVCSGADGFQSGFMFPQE